MSSGIKKRLMCVSAVREQLWSSPRPAAVGAALSFTALCWSSSPENVFRHSEFQRDGAAQEPSVTSLRATKDWALLQCEVRGAFPKPKLHWKNRAGHILHAEEPKVTERGGSYDVVLQITVTKTDYYRCVATQEEISHQTDAETHVLIHGFPIGMVVGAFFVGGAVVLFVLGVKRCISQKRNKDGGAAV